MWEKIKKLFGLLDLNKDGKVTAEDLEVARALADKNAKDLYQGPLLPPTSLWSLKDLSAIKLTLQQVQPEFHVPLFLHCQLS